MFEIKKGGLTPPFFISGTISAVSRTISLKIKDFGLDRHINQIGATV